MAESTQLGDRKSPRGMAESTQLGDRKSPRGMAEKTQLGAFAEEWIPTIDYLREARDGNHNVEGVAGILNPTN